MDELEDRESSEMKGMVSSSSELVAVEDSGPLTTSTGARDEKLTTVHIGNRSILYGI